jgi:hypothetical protein
MLSTAWIGRMAASAIRGSTQAQFVAVTDRNAGISISARVHLASTCSSTRSSVAFPARER